MLQDIHGFCVANGRSARGMNDIYLKLSFKSGFIKARKHPSRFNWLHLRDNMIPKNHWCKH